jgi:hypothetical protein
MAPLWDHRVSANDFTRTRHNRHSLTDKPPLKGEGRLPLYLDAHTTVPVPATEAAKAEFAQPTLQYDNMVRRSRLRGFTTALGLSYMHSGWVIAFAGIAVEVSHLDKSKETKSCLANFSETRTHGLLSICSIDRK